MAGGTAGGMAGRRQDPPVVVALGTVDPALVERVLGGHCRFVADPGVLDVLAGREPRAVADPAWRTQAPKEIPV